jgi:hypothetical protein
LKLKEPFHDPSKKVEGKHVEQEVHEILVDKSREDKAIPLVSLLDSVGDKHPAIQQGRAIEGKNAAECCHSDEERSQRKIHWLLFFAMHEFLGDPK